MTKTERNAALIEKLIRVAAKNGAKIVVTPECALQGYCHPPDWKTWTANPDEKGSPQVAEYAESIPGKHSERFAELARELGLYICLGMIEEKEGKFHNAQVLFGPDGKTLAIHRKSQLWPPGDGWCEAGPGTPTVVDTPYGKLGLMICFELHSMPEKLVKAKTDIVLYSVGWYGPNEREWFQHRFPRDIVKKNKLAIVLANWCGPGEGDSWPGLGFSSIYDSTGKILAMTGAGVEPKVVISNLPIHLEKKNKRKDGNEDKGKPKASARDGNARTLKRPK
jgi:predicted amidohydrolase